jgi:hypothetical protein
LVSEITSPEIPAISRDDVTPTHSFLAWTMKPTPGAALDPEYNWLLWRPSSRMPIPAGLRITHWLSFFARWLAYRLHLYAGGDYAVLVVRSGKRVVHHTAMTGPLPWTRFMRPTDLAVVAMHTEKKHRGKSVARFALQALTMEMNRAGRSIWFVARSQDEKAMSVAKASGYELRARGIEKNLLWIPIPGALEITEAVAPAPANASVELDAVSTTATASGENGAQLSESSHTISEDSSEQGKEAKEAS